MSPATQSIPLATGAGPETPGYLECRVREEADAAARASSLEATLAHVILATAYAKRLGAPVNLPRAADPWADAHRLW